MASAGPIAVSAGRLSVGASRTAPLLPDLLLAMMGYRGDIFEAVPDASTGASRVRLSPWVDWVSSAEREQLERLARLGDWFVELQAFSRWAQRVDFDDDDDDDDSTAEGWGGNEGAPLLCESQTGAFAPRPGEGAVGGFGRAGPISLRGAGSAAAAPRPGPLTAALGAAAEELLEAYAAEVESLSARLDAPPPPPPTALLERLAEFERGLPAALGLLRAATGWRHSEGADSAGGATAAACRSGAAAAAGGAPVSPWSPIEAACSSGDPVLEAVAGRLHRRLRAALWRLVEAWVGHGALLEGGWIPAPAAGESSGERRPPVPPASLFVVAGSPAMAHRAARPPRDARDVDAAEWHGGFSIEPRLLPAAFSRQAAEDVLFAGRAARALAACGARDRAEPDLWGGADAWGDRAADATAGRQGTQAARHCSAFSGAAAPSRRVAFGLDERGDDTACDELGLGQPADRDETPLFDRSAAGRHGHGRATRRAAAAGDPAPTSAGPTPQLFGAFASPDRRHAREPTCNDANAKTLRQRSAETTIARAREESPLAALGALLLAPRPPPAPLVRRACAEVRRAAAAALARAVARDADLAARLSALSDAFLMRRAGLCAAFLDEARATLASPPRPAEAAAAASRALLAAAAGAGPAADACLAEVAFVFGTPADAQTRDSSIAGRAGAATGAGPRALGAPSARAPGALCPGTSGASGAPSPTPTPPPLDAWDSLALTARPGWPLRLFVSPSAGRSYEAVWKLVFRLARVERALDDAWTAVRGWRRGRVSRGPGAAAAGDPLGGGRGGPLTATCAPPQDVLRRACALRARMAHVARTLRAHVQSDVAGTLWERLRAQLRRARDFAEADEAHDAYVAGLVRGALLDDPALMRVLGGILTGALEYAKRLAAAGEDALTNARSASAVEPNPQRSSPTERVQARRRDASHAHLAALVDVAAREFRLQYSIFLRLLAGSRPGGAERAPGVRRLLLKLDYDGSGMRDAALWEG